MSKFIQFSQTGEPEVLELVSGTPASPNDDEVIISVKAIGLNRADAMFRRGEYIFDPVLPAQLGTEAAGIVLALGRNVTHVSVGDQVNLVPSFPMGANGVYGEEIIVPGHAVVTQPPELTFEQAASIWVMFLTAYGPLIEDAKIQPGEHVIISAASSSVGLAAIQLAKLVGAILIALTRTGEKKQRLLDAGAQHVVVVSEVDLTDEILRITGGSGVRVAFDPVGGELLPKLIRTVPKGVIYLYGALGGETTTIPVLEALMHRTTIKAWIIADLLADEDRKRKAIDYVTDALRRKEISPVIDSVFAFEDMVAAHRHLESGRQFGKVVVKVGGGSEG
ncbi:NADPH:quinone reductase [Rhizobium deserti]|uniref:NADPH:quinone reductase n=1 Tax=Rhizobium deserti TaxID=2547961 RepID=A0A4R5U759_9HYPH|nr:zinc-dependent alcohol dehydrogenase family protein [Rhizobium deserti]TDK29893.1 NADPH:quinone reductase [Rhizobium deserti]